MDLFVVEGGKRLEGTIAVSGAKNAALPMMAAAILADGTTRLQGIPTLADVTTLGRVLESLGLTVTRVSAPSTVPTSPHSQAAGPDELQLTPHDASSCTADYELVRKMRASVCVLGPLLARRGRAIVSLPGGCNIGHRPIDLHLRGLRALGADIRLERGYVHATARRLQGAVIDLSGPQGSTVTGTCNVLSAATLARGRTVILAAAREPEVVDLGELLIAMGARVEGLGTPVITIDGVDELRPATRRLIPDRIEAGTLLIAAAITQGDLTLSGVCTEQLAAVLEVLERAGVQFTISGATIRAIGPAELKPVDCTALPYPGWPTDLQAQLTALLLRAPGISVITDKVFPDRFMHVPELNRMGAQIRRDADSAIVTGVNRLSGANVMASDLRASAALLLAALAADGVSVIRRIYHLDRGYELLDQKLCAVGARIIRTSDRPENLPAELFAAPRDEAPVEISRSRANDASASSEPALSTSKIEVEQRAHASHREDSAHASPTGPHRIPDSVPHPSSSD